MTTVYTSPLAASDPEAAGTHVFIIGVGEYPCLIGGKGKLLGKTMGLKQLSSPPVSAASLANWFLGRLGPSHADVGFHNPDVPLATVELLLSPSQPYAQPGGGGVLVEAAQSYNIVQAFERWIERAKANDSNIAVFYFCGHGVMGNDAYLLPSDFGAVHPSNPWADAIDIDQTAKAMRREVGCPLYFFIDACRQASRDPLSPGATPPALKYIDFGKPVRGFSRLILWANGEGEAAFGPAAKVSRFTQALIEALSGYEAEPSGDGNGWIVTGSVLANSVGKILETGNSSLEPDKYQHSEQQLISSLAFHIETARPHHIIVGMPSSWSLGAEVRQLLSAWKLELPEKAFEHLAEQLEAKNLQVETLQKEAKDWTRRFDALKLDIEGEPESELVQRARELLDAGKLKEAGLAYDALIKLAETRRDAENTRIASYSVNRGRIFRLDFRPMEALPYYEKAYGLCPSNPDYALNYADLLLDQCDYHRAEPVLIATIARLHELMASAPDGYRFPLSRALHSLGNLHTDEHHFVEARQAFEEALVIRRQLAQTNPAAYRPALAATLHGLGTLLVDKQCFAEGQQVFEETLTIRRELAQSNPALYGADVPRTLNNIGNLHYYQNRFAEARHVFEEALVIQRALAKSNPPAYRPDLARMLNNIGNVHVDERRFVDARQVFEEALGIHRELAQINPAAYRDEVARMLNNLGKLCTDEGGYEEARKAFEEALTIRRELAQANPSAYRPGLATTLDSLGKLESDQQHYAEAREAFEEALSIRREFAKMEPGTYRPPLAITLNNLGRLHRREHRFVEARQAFEEALVIRRELAETNPTVGRHDLATTLDDFGKLERDEHRYGEARQSFDEALVIRRELAQANPAAYSPDLPTTLNNLGILNVDEHRPAEAREAFEEAIKIQRALAQDNPPAYCPDLARMLNNLGELFLEEQRFAEARLAFEQALVIRRELVRKDPSVYRPDLATTLEDFGKLERHEHRFAEAREAFEEALAIRHGHGTI